MHLALLAFRPFAPRLLRKWDADFEHAQVAHCAKIEWDNDPANTLRKQVIK